MLRKPRAVGEATECVSQNLEERLGSGPSVS